MLQSCSGTLRSEHGREGSAVRALRRVDTSCIAVRCKLSSASEHRWKRPNCWSSTLSGTESGYLFPRLQTLSRSMSARMRAIFSNSIPLKSVRVKNMPDVYEIAGNCRAESCRTLSSGNLERHTSTRVLLVKTKRRIARSLGVVFLTMSPCHGSAKGSIRLVQEEVTISLSIFKDVCKHLRLVEGPVGALNEGSSCRAIPFAIIPY